MGMLLKLLARIRKNKILWKFVKSVFFFTKKVVFYNDVKVFF